MLSFRIASLVTSLLAAPACASPPGPSAPAPPSAFTPLARATTEREPRADAAGCPLLGWRPTSLRGSVLTIADTNRDAIAASIVEGVCRCTRPGDRLRVIARIVPGRGEVSLDAPDHPAIAACLASISPAPFTPFPLGSDCVDCGPHPVDPARRPAARPSTLLYPLRVDRSEEPPG